ncbi:hypothetical protein [Methylacidimicrobium cyclopophantes]|nr:hypothetical protein [Methylacidimicrobium cyclopophantes]
MLGTSGLYPAGMGVLSFTMYYSSAVSGTWNIQCYPSVAGSVGGGNYWYVYL